MSYERAIKNRKEELVTLGKALKEAREKKDTEHIDFLEPRIDGLKKSIKDLEEKMREAK